MATKVDLSMLNAGLSETLTALHSIIWNCMSAFSHRLAPILRQVVVTVAVSQAAGTHTELRPLLQRHLERCSDPLERGRYIGSMRRLGRWPVRAWAEVARREQEATE